MVQGILLFSLLLISCVIVAQSSDVGINPIGTNSDSNVGLDIDFNDKELLIPRLNSTHRDNIQNSAVALQIYNTTTNCLQQYKVLSGWCNRFCDYIVSLSSTFTFPENVTFDNSITNLNSYNSVY